VVTAVHDDLVDHVGQQLLDLLLCLLLRGADEGRAQPASGSGLPTPMGWT